MRWSHIVMSDYGYVEQEFFFEGTAKRYSSPTGGAPNNTTTAVVASTGHPYKTRLLVRRPTDPAKFNGIAIVEWVNVTNGYDVEIHWQESMAYYIREGYAFIGVSVQNAGVSGQGSPLRGLKAWSPTRYGTLNVNDNGAVGGDLPGYDIFSQAGQAVRNVSSVLGGLPVERVIAKGESQSAQHLHIYFNAIHHLDPVFDGAMITHNAGTIRSDISTPPIMRMYSENEINNAPTIQPDTSTLRTWTVAGATHSEYYTMIARAPILLRDHGLQAFDTVQRRRAAASRSSWCSMPRPTCWWSGSAPGPSRQARRRRSTRELPCASPVMPTATRWAAFVWRRWKCRSPETRP